MSDKTYDTIELQIEPADAINVPWACKCDRCIILLNGRDILDIIGDAELPFYKKEPDLSEEAAGCYHHMMPIELYEDLIEAEESNGEEIAHVLCCTCDETGCASARVRVLRTEDSIIWNDFRTMRGWDFGLSYEFEIDQYREFLSQIKQMIPNWYIKKKKKEEFLDNLAKSKIGRFWLMKLIRILLGYHK